MSDDNDADSVESLDYIPSISPQGKGRKLRDESYKPDIWNRRVEISDLSLHLNEGSSKPDIWNKKFQNPIRQENVEQFKSMKSEVLVLIKL